MTAPTGTAVIISRSVVGEGLRVLPFVASTTASKFVGEISDLPHERCRMKSI